MMRIKYIVLLLLLVLPIITANLGASLGSNNSLAIFDKEGNQVLLRSHRFKRQCNPCVGVPPPPPPPPHQPFFIVCCETSGVEEIFRTWWLNISLILLPMSISWLKEMFS